MLNPSGKLAKQVKKIPGPGQFSLDLPELDWEFCRENFSIKFQKTSVGLYFSCDQEQAQAVSAFIGKTEDVLINAALQNLNKSLFFSTNLNFAMWIEPSKFWMSCSMRRSLFTLLLRSGLNYKYDNYEDILFNNNHYSKITKNAIQRFMYGFTEFSYDGEKTEGIGKGWASFFGNLNTNEIYEKLINPNKSKKFQFGGEILWS